MNLKTMPPPFNMLTYSSLNNGFKKSGKKALSTFFVFLFSMVSALAQQYTINGDQDVCPADLESYVVTGTPAPVSAAWQVTTSNGTIVNYISSGCEVLWNAAGAAMVDVLLFDAAGTQLGSASLPVTVHPEPVPVMTTSFNSECVIMDEHNPTIDPDDCWNVCEQGGVNYYVNPFDPASNYSWSLAGGTLLVQTGNTIGVQWGAAGNGLVMVTETNQYGCTAVDSHCVNINESPIAILTADVQNADCRNLSQITVCVNQVVNFSADAILGSTNSPIIAWSWDFGDGTYSSLQDPTHQWSLAMTYTVTLTVTNACNCSGTCTMLVIVDPLTGVNIECVGPVCPNTVQEYYTDAVNCSQFAWQVTGGTISNTPYNTSSDVTIQWGSGANGPGMLCLSNTPVQYCSDYCPSTTCVEVPIVSATSTISGPALVCLGEQYTYSVPSMTGSIYTWTVTGGNIVLGQNTNEIVVTWNTTGSGTVAVTYNNAFLDCAGSGNLSVDVLTPFTISGPSEACPGDQLTFDAQNPSGNILDWTATDGNGTVNYLGSGTGQLTVNWTLGPGAFVITATPTGTISYCNATATLTLMVHTPPDAPVSITGIDLVCPGSANTYSAPPAASSITYNWTVTGGNPASATGSQVSVVWGLNAPYIVNLTQTNTVTGCVSAPYTKTINRKTYTQPVFDQAQDACINTLVTYNITNGYLGGGAYYYDDITWMISPSGAGSVTQGQGTTTATIQWNNTPVTGVTLWVSTRLCGADVPSGTFIQLDLVGSSTVQITPTNPGSTNTLDLCENQLQAFSVSGSWASQVWDYGDGSGDTDGDHAWSVIGMGAGPFTFPVTVLVTDASGCEATGSMNVNIAPAPPVALQVSPLCIEAPNGVTLTGLTPGSGSFNYQWNTGGNTQSIYVTNPGSYTLTITDQSSGCTNQIIQNVNNCGPISTACQPDPGGITPTITVMPNQPVCGSFQFTGGFNGSPLGIVTTYDWKFGDGTGTTGMIVNHQYSVAAAYSVTLTIYTQDGGVTYCTSITQIVNVPAMLDFNATLACPLSGTPGQYQVQFVDLSTYYPATPTSGWVWNFGGTPANSTLQNPGPYAMSDGFYSVQLELFNGTTSVCSITKPLTIPKPPDPDFLVVDPNQPLPAGPFCATQTLTEFVADKANVHHALWEFGDATSYVPLDPSNSIDAQKMYDGSYPSPNVNLTLYDFYGCSYASDTTFGINNQDLNGSIQPTTGVSFCPGATGLLYYFNLGVTPTSYLWSNGASTGSITVNSTGSYYLTVYNSSTGCSFPVPAFGNALTYNVPTPSIIGDLTLCEGGDMQLDGQSGISGPGYTFSWTVTDPQGIIYNTTGSQFSLTQVVAGTYQAVLTITSSSPACQTTATASIEVFPAPAPPLITVTPLPPCEDQAVLLSVNPMGNYVNWSTGQTNATIQVVASGVYQATLTNAAGCTATDEAHVLDNPYLDWFTTGCYELCDTLDVIIPGSGPIQFYKWDWLIDGVSVQTGTGSVPDWTIPALSMTGTHVFSVQLQVQNPAFPGHICILSTPEIEITFKNCPCDAQPEVKLYCVTPQIDDGLGPHVYHFVLTPNAQLPCTNTAQVQVTSDDGGITLLPTTIQPTLIEGLIQTSFSSPSLICFDLDITDPNEPLCNCLTTLCHRLPPCPYPGVCEETSIITNVDCIGTNQGNPVYSFDYSITFPGASFPLYVQFYAGSQGVLNGMNSVYITSPGVYTWSGTFEDTDISDGFCVDFSVYNFQTHTICTQRACENNPPANCRLGSVKITEEINDRLTAGSGLTLIPNPSMGETYLDYTLSEARAQLIITDMKGEVIRQWTLTDEKGRIQIMGGDFTPGVYTCQMLEPNGNRIIRKWIVL